MSSPLSDPPASAEDTIINNNASREKTRNSNTNANTNPSDMTVNRNQQDGQHQPPREPEPEAASSSSAPPPTSPTRRNNIEIYIHSPTTTTSSGGSDGGPLSPQRISMAQYSRPKTFRKLSNSSSIISEIFRQPSDHISEQRLRMKIKRANERDTAASKDLVEFLRTTSPPPRSPRCSRLSLSAFYGGGGGGGGGNRSSSSFRVLGGGGAVRKKTARIPFWAICRRWRARRLRRKQKRKQLSEKEKSAAVSSPDPPLIKLPDSAVAGRTTGGHRHIAISIPVEYDHLGDLGKGSTDRTKTPSSSVRPGVSTSISLDRVPPRTSSIAASNRNSAKSLVKPGAIIRSHTSGGSSSLIPRQPGNQRPRTADPQADQRSRIFSFDTYTPTLNHANPAMEMQYPVLRHQPSFGYMTQLSYHEIINHQNSYPELSSSGSEADVGGKGKMTRSPPQLHTVRSLTFGLPPGYQLGGRHPAGVKLLSNKSSGGDDSVPATKENSAVEITEPEQPRLCLSRIMTVADIRPSFSVESLRVLERGTENPVQVPAPEVLSPEPTRVPIFTSPVLSPPTSSFASPLLEVDGESTPKASSSFAARSARHEQQQLPSVIVKHHRPSIEQVLFSSPSPNFNSPAPEATDTASPQTDSHTVSAATLPSTASGAAAQTLAGSSTRTASHQALIKQYEALRETREQEMAILLDRLERLETKNDWWLNSVVPMVENMSRRLTRIYDDESLPRLERGRGKKRASTSASTTATTFESSSSVVSNRAGAGVSRESTTVRRPLSSPNNREDYMDLSTESSLDSFLPPLTLSRPSEFQSPFHHQATFYDQLSGEGGRNIQQQRRLPEPETSLSSFDGFTFDRRQSRSRYLQQSNNRPGTSMGPVSPTRFQSEPDSSSPYPYSYIYPGASQADESLEQSRHYPLQVPGVGGGGDSRGNNIGHVSRLRYNSSNDSLPQGGFSEPAMNMGMDARSSISSTWDHQPDYRRPQPQPLQPPLQPSFQERTASPSHDNANTNTDTNTFSFNRNRNFTFGFGSTFGHGMGLAVDRLPSRHGERGLLNSALNSVSAPGGGGGDNNQGDSHSHSHSPRHSQPHVSCSSARVVRPIPQRSPGSRTRSRSKPQSMLNPRQADNHDHDCACGNYEQEGDDHHSEQEYYDEEEDQACAAFDKDKQFSGTRQQESNSNNSTGGRRSNSTKRVNFLQESLIPQRSSSTNCNTGTCSSRSRSKLNEPTSKPRPISWPSSYRPTSAQLQPQTTGTETQTQIPAPQPTIRRTRERNQDINVRQRAANGGVTNRQSTPSDNNQNYQQQAQQEDQQQDQQQDQQHPEQQRQTEWDTLEPLMRGLTETTRLEPDLNPGRDLDLGSNSNSNSINSDADREFPEST